MRKSYVLTSENFPKSGTMFDQQNDQTTIQTELTYTLQEVPQFGSLSGVEISDKTRFIAWLSGDGEIFEPDTDGELIFGVIGDIRKRHWLSYALIGTDGKTLAEWDQDDGECQQFKILPPEAIGLASFPWWRDMISRSET